MPGHVREASYALGQGEDHDDPQGAAALDPAEASRAAITLGPRADHRRHGDRRDPAGRDAAPGRRRRRAGALDAARDGRHVDELRQILLASRRRQRSAEKAYAAAFVLLMMVHRAERAGDAHHARAPRHVRAHRGVVLAAVLEQGGARRARTPYEPYADHPARAGSPATASPTVIEPGPLAPPDRDRGVPRSEAPAHRTGAARLSTAHTRRARRQSSGCRSKAVWLAYGERWVVRDVSLPVRQGEVLALIGASGSGKTTLLRSLNRLTEITDWSDARGADRARRAGDREHGGERAAAARVDGLSAAQPVPDEHLRERRLRAARGARPGTRPQTALAHASWSRK